MVHAVVSPPPDVSGKHPYSVGRLRYTKAGLFVLFAWPLWGISASS